MTDGTVQFAAIICLVASVAAYLAHRFLKESRQLLRDDQVARQRLNRLRRENIRLFHFPRSKLHKSEEQQAGDSVVGSVLLDQPIKVVAPSSGCRKPPGRRHGAPHHQG